MESLKRLSNLSLSCTRYNIYVFYIILIVFFWSVHKEKHKLQVYAEQWIFKVRVLMLFPLVSGNELLPAP